MNKYSLIEFVVIPLVLFVLVVLAHVLPERIMVMILLALSVLFVGWLFYVFWKRANDE